MNFNFKKYNLLIIMLLIFVIVSCIVYVNMQNVKESFINQAEDYGKYFTYTGDRDLSYNYYISLLCLVYCYLLFVCLFVCLFIIICYLFDFSLMYDYF